jgi:hypothetical protein
MSKHNRRQQHQLRHRYVDRITYAGRAHITTTTAPAGIPTQMTFDVFENVKSHYISMTAKG